MDAIEPLTEPTAERETPPAPRPKAAPIDSRFLFVDVAAKHEEAKSVTEEEVTGALVRALKGGKRTACFLNGFGEPTLEDNARGGLSRVKELLEDPEGMR